MIESASQIVWRAAGSPEPCDVFGEPIPKACGGVERCAKWRHYGR